MYITVDEMQKGRVYYGWQVKDPTNKRNNTVRHFEDATIRDLDIQKYAKERNIEKNYWHTFRCMVDYKGGEILEGNVHE